MLKITVAGSLGSDADVKPVNAERNAINFSVATKKIRYEENKKIESTEWIECAMYVKNDKDSIAKYLVKGQAVIITGYPIVKQWVNQTGEHKACLGCTVDDLEFIGASPKNK